MILGGDLKAFSGDMGVIGVAFSTFLVCPTSWWSFILSFFDIRNKRHTMCGTIQKNLNAPRTVAHTYAKWT